MVGKLNFFLGFQIQQGETGIFIFQEKYARNLINKFGLNQAKAKRTPAAIQIKVSNADGGKKVDKSLSKYYKESIVSQCKSLGYCLCHWCVCSLSRCSS
ncbi:putative mitochondrial protein [Cucumis melo var. makuwa]|nr:putative mitochondrial protein [Cucumis melo var. makuwa]